MVCCMLHDRDLSARAEIVAAQLDALFDSLPSGYECDKQLATFNDSYTYGEIQTRDIAVIAHNVTEPAQLTFAELGSGLGKFAIAAGFFFKHSFGIEFAPERSAVAQRALVALGERAPPNVALTTGDLREFPLHCIDVVFAHNLVFSSGLERALELKLDCELADGVLLLSSAMFSNIHAAF